MPLLLIRPVLPPSCLFSAPPSSSSSCFFNLPFSSSYFFLLIPVLLKSSPWVSFLSLFFSLLVLLNLSPSSFLPILFFVLANALHRHKQRIVLRLSHQSAASGRFLQQAAAAACAAGDPHWLCWIDAGSVLATEPLVNRRQRESLFLAARGSVDKVANTRQQHRAMPKKTPPEQKDMTTCHPVERFKSSIFTVRLSREKQQQTWGDQHNRYESRCESCDVAFCHLISTQLNKKRAFWTRPCH